MHEPIEVGEALWSTPVTVRVGYGFPEPVRGPQQALDYLTQRWPVRDGIYYNKALAECVASLERKMAPEAVRDSFVLASIEAKMLD